MLNHYGIRGLANSLIQSYLENGRQIVKFNNANSNYLHRLICVPKGSILGPLLFIPYLNGICNVSEILKCRLFRDDTNMFVSGNGIYSL